MPEKATIDAEAIAGLARILRTIADNPALLDVARLAIEDRLVEYRDARISVDPVRNNGLVIRERDGTKSNVIRFGPEEAMRTGLKAIADDLQKVIGDATEIAIEIEAL